MNNNYFWWILDLSICLGVPPPSASMPRMSWLAYCLLQLQPGGGVSLRTFPWFPQTACKLSASGLPRAASTACEVRVVRAADSSAADARTHGLGAILPPPDDLADEEMLKIVLSQTKDQDVNELVWKYLGYRRHQETGEWDSSAVFPNWRQKYPTPPDLIGVTRTYSKEVDEPVMRYCCGQCMDWH